MGLILFILGVMMIVGGIGFGLPMVWRDAMGLGLGILLPCAILGLTLAIIGLIKGKTPEPEPAAPPPPPTPPAAVPQGLQCPQCNRRLPLGVNKCPFCYPDVPAAPPPPPPPPPPMPAAPQPIQAGFASKGRGAVVGPNGYMQILAGPATGRQFPIAPNQQVTIGRAEDNTLCIPDAEVSSRHCMLTFQNDKVMFQDLGSSNGSFLNGQPYRQGYINSGDQLRLGRETTIFFSFK
jgi:hypothetical protein